MNNMPESTKRMLRIAGIGAAIVGGILLMVFLATRKNNQDAAAQAAANTNAGGSTDGLSGGSRGLTVNEAPVNVTVSSPTGPGTPPAGGTTSNQFNPTGPGTPISRPPIPTPPHTPAPQAPRRGGNGGGPTPRPVTVLPGRQAPGGGPTPRPVTVLPGRQAPGVAYPALFQQDLRNTYAARHAVLPTGAALQAAYQNWIANRFRNANRDGGPLATPTRRMGTGPSPEPIVHPTIQGGGGSPAPVGLPRFIAPGRRPFTGVSGAGNALGGSESAGNAVGGWDHSLLVAPAR